MRLSVIVPSLNEAGDIDGLMADLGSLRARGHELLLVDGGSTDATVERAAAFVDRVIVCPPGRARQMNAGAAAAAGDVLWFLHADTRLPPEADQLLLDALATAPWGRFDVRLSGQRLSLRVIERAMNLRSRLTGICTGDQGLFVTRRLFEQVGGYESVPLMEDVRIAARLRRVSAPACVGIPLVTSSRRWERDGVVGTVLLMWRLRLGHALGEPPEKLARLYDGTV